MAWTGGEIITATRLEDKNELGDSGGIAGIDGLRSMVANNYKNFRGGFGNTYTVVAGDWTENPNASQTDWDDILVDEAGYKYNSTSADSDEIKWSDITLNAGSYTIKIAAVKFSSRGILELLHGTTSIGTEDLYNATVLYNHIITFAYSSTSRTTADLRLRVNGKNASSTGYIIALSRFEMFQTAHLFSGMWTNSGNLNTARRDLAAFGTQSAGVSCGGDTGAVSAVTELFNGSTWSNSGALNTARTGLAAFGTQSAGVSCGGFISAASAITELFNGSTWANSGNLNTARYYIAAFGTQSAGVSCGGDTDAVSAVTELFNGSTWSNSGNLNTARWGLAAFGTQSAGVSCGGYTGGNSAVTELFNGSTWSNSGNLNTARNILAAFGTQSAGVSCGGFISAASAITELFNGSTWANSGNLNTARYGLATFGNQSAGVSCGGYTATYSAATELS